MIVARHPLERISGRFFESARYDYSNQQDFVAVLCSEALEAKIREASSIAQVSLLLSAWIDENIIRLRFAEVADGWKQAETVILEKANALNATLRKVTAAPAETGSTFAQRLDNCEPV